MTRDEQNAIYRQWLKKAWTVITFTWRILPVLVIVLVLYSIGRFF